jgi:hypothetical protein
MEKKPFHFTYRDEYGSPKNLVLYTDEIATIETLEYADNGVTSTDSRDNNNYAVVLYSKGLTLAGKKTNRLILPFDNQKERDEMFEALLAMINPTRFDTKFIIF